MSEKISITKDAMKAEAKIRRMRNNRNAALEKVHDKYLQAEQAYVAGLPHEVLPVLIAAQVLPPMAPESHTTGEWIDIADTVPDAPVLS